MAHENQTQSENSKTGIQYTMFREYHQQPYHMATLKILHVDSCIYTCTLDVLNINDKFD